MATCREGAMGLSVYFIALLSISYGFNLDPRFSVIKKGPANSYFGFSVAEHQTVDDNADGDPADLPALQSLILIGAPKANSEPLGINNTGAIYKCPSDTTREDDCQQLKTDPFDKAPDAEETLKDQWLGVVVRSQGKGRKVLACAHRYMRGNYGLGLCYTLLQSLDYQEKWRPCLGRPVEQLHRQFGVCQAGISGILLPDDGFVVGAPGSFDWRGVVFKANVSETLGADKAFYFSPVPPPEGAEGETTGPQPPVDKYAYLGYSVASGVFDQSKAKYYVAGAPRSGQTGEIVLFTQVPGSHLMYADNQIIKGKRDFSAFGHDILALDINSDGYDDLIVGAPFFHLPGVGGAIYVYIGGKSAFNEYTTEPIEIRSRAMSDQECNLLQCEHARFGFSLAKAGDLNGDGYQDFAVGAPYEGNGTVYIFHGSKDGFVKQFAQRINAEAIPSDGLTSFGYSLSGGIDMDNNGYPDLVVGSYESNEIALIRARPIIHLTSDVTLTPKMIDLADKPYCSYDKTEKRCIQIEICLKFSAEPKDRFQSRPKIIYTVETEKTRSISRLTIKDPTEPSGRLKKATIRLYQQTNPSFKCETEIAYLEDTFQDKLNPLVLDISYSLDEKDYTRPTPGEPLLDINDYPILAATGKDMESMKTTLTTKVEFVKDCIGTCESNLQFQATLDLPRNSAGHHILSQGEKDVITLTVSVLNLGEAAYLTRVYLKKPETLNYQGVETINSTNPETEVKCGKMENNDTMVECSDIGNPLPKDESVLFRVKLDPSDLSPSQTEHNLVVWVNTSSEETTPENDRIPMSFRVIIRAQMTVTGRSSPDDPIIYSGTVRGESAIKIEDEIGPPINHTFVVTNGGPGTVNASTLTIYWPYQVENNEPQGKHLLYLMQTPQVMRGPAYCTIQDPKIINPLKIQENPDYIFHAPSRTTRTSDVPAKSPGDAPLRKRRASLGEIRTKRKDRRDVILDCDRKTAKCHKIVCQIEKMEANTQHVEIKIRARLWESTLLQDYMNIGEVKIRAKAELYIDPALNIESADSVYVGYATTIAIPDVKEQQAYHLAWWIILVAVLVGVILLFLLVLLLWKLGFFKRRKPEDMATYKVEVEKQKGMEDEEA